MNTGARPRRVLILVDQYVNPYGGTEGQIHSLLEGLPASWRAEMWVLQPGRWLEQNAFPCHTRGLGLRSLARPWACVRLLALGYEVKRCGFDLVLTFMNDASIVGPLLAARAGVPALISRRDLGFWQTPRILAVLQCTNRLTRGTIANCEAVARHTVWSEHVPPDSLAIVPNGHDPCRFDVEAEAGLRERLGIPPDAPLVGLLANIKPLKRQADLLEAVARLTDRHPDLHALLIGDVEPPGAPIDAWARQRGIGARVHHLVALGGALPLLKHLDIGVLCSETEGLSNAILEYMGSSLPVVATNIGGNPDLVADGENGFLYEPGDVEALADRLDRLVGDPDLAREMGRASRRRFEERFTGDRMVRETTRLWARALSPPDADAETDDLTWEVVDDVEALEALAPAWDALLGPDHFFLGPDWVLAWIEHGEVEGSPCVLVARDRTGALVGLLPLVRRGHVLGFAGQGEGADHLDVVAAPGRARDIAHGALAFLSTLSWRRLRWLHLAEAGALRAALHAFAWALPYRERLATVCPYIRIQGTYEDYLSRRFSRKSRKNLRRELRRFRETEGAHLEYVVEPERAADAVDRFLQLHDARFEARGETSALAPARIRTFLHALAERTARSGRLSLVFLKLGERDLACTYDFRHRDKAYYFQGGFDETTPFKSPGTILRALVLEENIEAGLAEYDFLDGWETYKRRWATDERRLFDVEVHRPTLAGRASCLAHGAARLAFDLVREPGDM